MSTRQRIIDIDNALFDIYSQYPFVTVRNSQTEALWREWERLVSLSE